jgi:hypothetical protein
MCEQEAGATSKVTEIWTILYRMFTLNKAEEWGRTDRIKTFSHIVRGYFEKVVVDSQIESDLAAIAVPTVCQTTISDSDLRRLAREISALRFDSRLEAQSYVEGAIYMTERGSEDYGARAVANLLHGIDLPRQPMHMW